MKKTLLAVMISFISVALFAQNAPMMKMSKKDAAKIAVTHPQILKGTENGSAPRNVTSLLGNGSSIGSTYYDLQTNGTMSPRVAVYPDGTIGAVWTTSSSTSSSRGTGYNYFNGSSWINDGSSTDRIESVRTGWATYAALGNGEIVAAHNGSDALVIGLRAQKGTGDWTFTNLYGPTASTGSASSTCLLWPAIATNGNTVHLIACTESDAGYLYQGIQTCLVYIRGTYSASTNTVTWEAPRVVGDVTPTQVASFSGDSYALAVNGDYVAVLVADSWNDVFLWKSADNGLTFTKTTIIDSPIPDGYVESSTLVVDTPYVSDGSCALALADNGTAHIAFGITRVNNDNITDGSYSYYPGVNGLFYWNETMPTIQASKNTLDPDTIALMGYKVFTRLDLDGDDTAWYMNGGNFPSYGVGMTSMPQLIADGNNVYLIYASALDYPMMDYSSDSYFRGIFGVKSTDGGATWTEGVNGTSWLSYNRDCFYVEDWDNYTMEDYSNCLWQDGENVFPSFAPSIVNNKLTMIWQLDYFAGNEIKDNNAAVAGQPSWIYFMQLDPAELGTYNRISEVYQGHCIDHTGIADNTLTGMKLFPNPASNSVNVGISSTETSPAVLSVYNLMGQVMYNETINLVEGNNFMNINISNLNAGIYMVNIKTNAGTSTQKLIVK